MDIAFLYYFCETYGKLKYTILFQTDIFTKFFKQGSKLIKKDNVAFWRLTEEF